MDELTSESKAPRSLTAPVAENNDFWCCNEDFWGGDSGTSMAETVDDAVHVAEVFPDEPPDAGILRDRLIPSIRGFIA